MDNRFLGDNLLHRHRAPKGPRADFRLAEEDGFYRSFGGIRRVLWRGVAPLGGFAFLLAAGLVERLV